MIDKSLIEKAKQYPIINLMYASQHKPVKQTGKEVVFHSPFRSEKSPSFYINIDKNTFYDFGGTEQERGDVIRLTQLLLKVNFLTAINLLTNDELNRTKSFSFSGLKEAPERERGIKIEAVKTVSHPALVNYIQERGINIDLAKIYLNEVHYSIHNKKYFAVGFKNDNEGFDLRNKLNFKGGKTINGITTFNCNTKTVTLFEGFFDFLAYLEDHQITKPPSTTIVLNSCNNLPLALKTLDTSSFIECYLDNDNAGLKAVESIIKAGFNTINKSIELFPTCKDYNDYLLEKRNKTNLTEKVISE